MPKLSVITICYNDLNGLKKTVASVVEQTFAGFEYIVIDGGSSDGSAEYIAAHASSFTKWVSEKDGGIYNAQNKGWKLASGDYCLFLNSGDYLANANVLEIMMRAATADIVYGNILVDNTTAPLYELGQHDPFTFEDMIYTTLFHPAAFIKRTLLAERGGYDESFRIVADYDFFLEMICVKKVSTQYIPVPVSVFNTAGVSSDPANKAKHDAERRRSQLKYFPLEKIEAAEAEVQKRKPRSLRIKESVSGIPVLREVTNFALLMYNRLRR
jgi:glycosyltransferase involved in cell wall biosynthesis